ncbi:uncharacterized protein Z520_05435 [Fonsecaea multimorphosa CBS 102226]|uniref:DUF2241 domain-containing protein n=1 Tax=Fonsecaea multimorphosa CBS 102226 TaxID=1442371 RepID=A0A0D2K752_9EURO|nr:uncharacterized protein Z520_05435 [Fonsecaea multimorphosa CBS 102226]KIX98974.1 hypothetical protein Z520_05435 [Fonsecaea multimorphosa CBS 102226]OAL25245.1 hypothetical protein AYO22_05122 [Fonsecaea multimorphosa]
MSDVNIDSGGGETSLPHLLSSLRTTLHPETYVFASITGTHLPVPLEEICLFFREPRERTEAVTSLPSSSSSGSGSVSTTTLILPLETARKHNLQDHQYTYPCRMITCAVHSSLAAVGFMAVLATRLAREGISVNPVSGFYHDHLFVPVERADEAVAVLGSVREEAIRDLGRKET